MDSSATPRPLAEPFQIARTREGRRVSLYNFIAAYVVLDLILLLCCGTFNTKFIRFISDVPLSADASPWALTFAIIFYFAAAKIFDGYGAKAVVKLETAIERAGLSLACAFTLLLVIAVATKTAENYSRSWFFSWVVTSFALIVLTRVVLVNRLRGQLARGGYVEKATSIGIDCDPIRPSEIARQTGNEVRVVASSRLSDEDELNALSEQIAQLEIDQVFIAAPWEKIPAIVQKLGPLRHLSAKMFLLPADRKLCREIAHVAKFGDRLSLCAVEQSIYGWSLWFKRAEDLAIATLALAALAPLMVLIAIAIRLDSPGPIFFRQLRVGFNGRKFRLWKFRSMYVEMTDDAAQKQTSRDDARVTRVGRLIRRASIDELPQLFNVIEGSMSIVGPRPHALATKTDGRNLDEIVDYYAVRHRMKPGITGWAQVHGLRGELTSIEKLRSRVNYDLDYIDNWTIWLDLEIVFRTAMLMLFGDKHAY